MTRIVLLLFITVLYFACNSGSDDSSSSAQERSEIKNDSLIMEKGAAIALEAQQKLFGTLSKAISDSGISHAIQFCSIEALPLTHSVGEAAGVEVSRVSHKPRNPLNIADAEEMKIIERYQTLIAQNAEPKPKVVHKDEHITYYRPIEIPGQICLNCHGVPGEDIKEEDYITIQMLYPKDKATGFAVGDLRGMWKIKFDKATL